MRPAIKTYFGLGALRQPNLMILFLDLIIVSMKEIYSLHFVFLGQDGTTRQYCGVVIRSLLGWREQVLVLATGRTDRVVRGRGDLNHTTPSFNNSARVVRSTRDREWVHASFLLPNLDILRQIIQFYRICLI